MLLMDVTYMFVDIGVMFIPFQVFKYR